MVKEEKGAVQIIEATIIFPVMFLILFSLIYMGNCFYIKAQVEALAERYAIKGANHCADSLLDDIESGAGISLKSDSKPYRYIFGNDAAAIESTIEDSIRNEINGSSASFFRNMKPVIETCEAKYDSHFVYANFYVDIKCSLYFPITFFGESPRLVTFSGYAEVPVSDTPELIRNIDMVSDYLEGTKVKSYIVKVFSKITEVIGKFANAGGDK